MKDSKPIDFYLSESPCLPDSLRTADKECIFCAGRESETPHEIFSMRDDNSLPNSLGWHTRVIPWLDYVFRVEGDLGRKAVGMYDRMNSIGANEIIIESPFHNESPEESGIKQMACVLKTYRQRYLDLERDFRLRYTCIYKDQEPSIEGVRGHSHSKVVCPPVMPKGIKDELDGAKQFFYYKERCIFCDMLSEELSLGKRVVMETRGFAAFVPYAPKSPFECWVLPKRHDCSYQNTPNDEIDDLALLLTSLLKKMKKALKNTHCAYTIHNVPNRMPRKDYWHTIGEDFHWHIEIAPKIKRSMAIDIESDFYVLHTSPEDAAKFIQEAR